MVAGKEKNAGGGMRLHSKAASCAAYGESLISAGIPGTLPPKAGAGVRRLRKNMPPAA